MAKHGNGAPAHQERNVVSGVVGNVLEWYDFAIYGVMASTIGQVFFSSDDEFASLLLAFSVFAVSSIVRPLGGLLVGYVGDRLGRKRALIITVVSMGLSSALVGVLPGYAQIGVWASVALVVLRIIQGLCVGGEYPGSVVFLVEHAPADRRGLYASWITIGSVGGFLVGVAVAAGFNLVLGEAAMRDWGWRLPFLLGSVLAVTGIYFRRHMSEPAVFLEAEQSEQSPLTMALKDHWRVILRIIALSLVNVVGFYLLWVYAISYLEDVFKAPDSEALEVNFLSLCVMVVALYFSGIAIDRYGRLPLLYAVSVGTVLLAVPLWWLMSHANFAAILVAQSAFAVLYGIGFSSMTTVMAELLPTQVRCSAASLGYNVGVGFFGGMTPLVAAWLAQRTGDELAPGFLLAGFGVISLLATLSIKETRHAKLTRQESDAGPKD